MEASAGAIDDLEPLTLFHGQVDQQRAVREVGEGLWMGEGLRGCGRGRCRYGPAGRMGGGGGATLKAMNLW